MNPLHGMKLGVLGFLGLTSGCVPTISMHSYRNVVVTITKADTGEPVPSLRFCVIYYTNPVEGPFYHLELRTPRKVRAETDENGEAVVKLADYDEEITVEIEDNVKGYAGSFTLNKDLIRKGGAVEERPNPNPDMPTLRLNLQPIKRPNPHAALDPGRTSFCMRLPFAPVPESAGVDLRLGVGQ